MSDQPKRPSVIPSLSYRDPAPMLDWLERAFGFERYMVITDANGDLAHAEMSFGDGMIMVGSEWTDDHRSPASLGGKTTQTVHIHVEAEIDAHCERARAAGATIQQEPETQFYGDRTYRARDPEGQIWTFGQTVQLMEPAEWDAGTGLKTTMYA